MHVEPSQSPASAAPAPGPAPGDLPTRGLDLLWFGMQQPLLGLRVVLREPGLRRIAAVPLVFLVGVCLLAAASESEVGPGIELFFTTMLSLAAVPVILFGGSYRRLAAAARGPLGLSPRETAHPPLRSAIVNAIYQMILVAIGLVPVYLFVEFMAEWAGLGALTVGLAWLLGLLWTLHWISIEALDNAQTLVPGADEADEQRAIEEAGDPWFVRLYIGPLRPFGKLLRRLSRPWRRELEVLARAPALVLGFGLGVAGLLLIPMGALVFRPAAIVGGVHLLGRLERPAAAAAPVAQS